MTLEHFVHVYQPGAGGTLLLLHGTGGNEHDLMDLGQAIAPGWGVLSARGQISEGGAARWFRRFAEGVFDLEDFAVRVTELADWVALAKVHYGIERPLVGLGYSNGANIGAGLMQRHPGVLDGLVMLRGMEVSDEVVAGENTGHALLLNGARDMIVPLFHPPRVVAALETAGVTVRRELVLAGHELTREDVQIAQEWVNTTFR